MRIYDYDEASSPQLSDNLIGIIEVAPDTWKTRRFLISDILALGTIASNITTITNAASPYTILSTDYILRVDCTNGDVVVNFPTSVGATRNIKVKKIDSTSNLAKYTPAFGEKIENEIVSYDSAMPGEFMEFMPVGSTGWERIG